MALPGFEDVPGLSPKVIAQSTNCLRYLQQHTTEDKPRIAYNFRQAYGFQPSEVAALIGYLRMQGYPIGSNNRGYFWAREPDELNKTIEHMESRLVRQRRITEKLKQIQRAMQETGQQQEIFK